MDNLHLHKVREVRHISHEMLIKAQKQNAMCEFGGTGDRAIVKAVVTPR